MKASVMLAVLFVLVYSGSYATTADHLMETSTLKNDESSLQCSCENTNLCENNSCWGRICFYTSVHERVVRGCFQTAEQCYVPAIPGVYTKCCYTHHCNANLTMPEKPVEKPIRVILLVGVPLLVLLVIAMAACGLVLWLRTRRQYCHPVEHDTSMLKVPSGGDPTYGVAEMEQEMKPMKEQITAEERSTVKYDQKVEEWKGKVDEANKISKQLQDQLESVSERMQQLQPECSELKSRVQERNRELKTAEAALHRKRTNLRDLEKDKDQLNKRIKELKHSISQMNSADTQARVEKMNHIQAELEELSFRDSTLAQQIDQFKQACESAKERHARMSRERQDLQRAIDSKQRDLAAMESSRNNQLRRFGEHIPALMEAIDEAHHRGKFRMKPVGPLGNILKVSFTQATPDCLFQDGLSTK